MRRSGLSQRPEAKTNRNQWLEPGRRRRGAEEAPPATERPRRLTRRAKVMFVLLALVVAAPIATWAVRSGRLPLESSRLDDALSLQTISVEGNRRAPAEELVAATGLTAGTPLLDIDVEAVRALVEAHPWVDRARIVRVPPSLVLVSVVEREPLVVAAAEGEDPWLVDADGVPFAKAAPDDVAALPWLASPHSVRDRVASMELARGASLAQALRGSALADSAEIHITPPPDPEGLWLLVEGIRGRVVLGYGDLPDKLRRLEKLRLAGLPETPGAAVIDLRFADRAVLRSDAPPEPAQHTSGTPVGVASPPPGRRS